MYIYLSSCFTCEPRAKIEALDLYETLPILEQAKGLVISCDSNAALQAILNRGSWITEEICSRLFRLQELDKVYFLQWLPAHVDIIGSGNGYGIIYLCDTFLLQTYLNFKNS
ncbi:hypothetical protein TNCV_3371491 [Trichonephila clavipes]|nr:hypothetical protein TNCV_3371491 [Trichonephila clavipes]